jgi:hypothetical protein
MCFGIPASILFMFFQLDLERGERGGRDVVKSSGNLSHHHIMLCNHEMEGIPHSSKL